MSFFSKILFFLFLFKVSSFAQVIDRIANATKTLITLFIQTSLLQNQYSEVVSALVTITLALKPQMNKIF